MKRTLTIIAVLLLVPPVACAQADAQIGNAVKGPARAWENAADATKASWAAQREAIRYVDLADDGSRQIVIAHGSPKPGDDHAHPTTSMLEDSKTVFCVWNLGHGGHAGPMARSDDGGLSWTRLDDALPPIGGPISKTDPFRCIMTFSSIVRLKDGSHLGLFHRGSGIGEEGTLQVLQSITCDGGFTWSEPVMACDGTKLDGKHPCEPYVFRSPGGDELCCLMRENRRSGTGLVMFSRDEGKTWSQAVDAPWGLTGDRHHGIRLPDGRMVIVFRNASPKPKDKGFIAWVGTYEDIKQGRPGQYRVSLLKAFKDGFYPGIHLLPDGTIVATTYANYREEDIGCSIVSVRFTMSEVETMAKPLK